MKHSNQIREFVITSDGIDLLDVYVGPEGVLTGSLRAAQEAREKSAALDLEQEMKRRQRELERRRTVLAAQIDALQHEVRVIDEESAVQLEQFRLATNSIESDRSAAARRRGGDGEKR
jgi:circadian clock protein KaiC